ncbi:lytic transglycosylase domain-containing protein [Nitratireductor basaltis]|uniref:Lytic transglycosylase, catalytic n=1 Tax=Nitratireductor basaltis TaxID=472175 RepID=A0A084U9P9_9HYPH|nr:transglycosylase SLT domain-containing protein [Nitratireductor basaltis]KFB09685.1 Lytic transglycosylase, catalytic [Nitratireductor basaltis]
MKIHVFLAAALAAGTISFAANAKDGPAAPQTQQAASQNQKTFGDLMKDVLRAGQKPKGAAAASAQAKSKKLNIDNTTTASVRTPKKTAAKTAAVKAQRASGSRPYHSIVAKYASQYGVPVSLAHAVISVESNYRPSARGAAGEVGLMQIKPATARMMGYSGSVKALYNPETNIKYGLKYLAKAHKLGGGTTCGTILKYNAGHGAKRMNPISSAYCKKVQRILAKG